MSGNPQATKRKGGVGRRKQGSFFEKRSKKRSSDKNKAVETEIVDKSFLPLLVKKRTACYCGTVSRVGAATMSGQLRRLPSANSRRSRTRVGSVVPDHSCPQPPGPS